MQKKFLEYKKQCQKSTLENSNETFWSDFQTKCKDVILSSLYFGPIF